MDSEGHAQVKGYYGNDKTAAKYIYFVICTYISMFVAILSLCIKKQRYSLGY